MYHHTELLPSKSVSAVGSLLILTTRERECLSYITRGYTMKLMANKIGISVRTVESHLNNIKRKLCCRSKIELIQFVERTFPHITTDMC